MEIMRPFQFLLATIVSVLLCLSPVECTKNRFRPNFDRGPPPGQQQQPGPQQPPQPQWPSPPMQPMQRAQIPRNNWRPGAQPPQPQPSPFEQSRPQQPAPPPPAEASSFRRPPFKTFQSSNEIPVDEVVKPPEAAKSEEKILDAVDKLSEEIVEAVVERLEEDEALAIELEREGFDPNASSVAVRSTFTASPLLVLTLTICAYFVKIQK